MNAPVWIDRRSHERTSSRPVRPTRVAFLYLAQAHHVAHSLGAAVDLARTRPNISVDIVAASTHVLAYGRQLADAYGGAPLNWRLLGPAWLRALPGPDGGPMKAPLLALTAAELARYDAIVTPERTTAMLRRLGVRTKLIYTQHGAGDRAGPFEPRLGRFDLVFAAGKKQRDRIVGAGLVPSERCAIVGYPKFEAVEALSRPLPRLFREQRPTVLYNPHFLAAQSSWPAWGRRVLERFAGQDRYNLIFAPHIRLFGGRAPERTPELAAFIDHPAIHMDLGGEAAVDMTYVRAADLYLGDASSQIYEFVQTPRPAVFLNPHAADWRDDESYAHWRFGPVVDRLDDLLPTLEAAFADPQRYLRAQEAGLDQTFSITGESAGRRAARAIASLLPV